MARRNTLTIVLVMLPKSSSKSKAAVGIHRNNLPVLRLNGSLAAKHWNVTAFSGMFGLGGVAVYVSELDEMVGAGWNIGSLAGSR